MQFFVRFLGIDGDDDDYEDDSVDRTAEFENEVRW